jgi:hypothetical protein
MINEPDLLIPSLILRFDSAQLFLSLGIRAVHLTVVVVHGDTHHGAIAAVVGAWGNAEESGKPVEAYRRGHVICLFSVVATRYRYDPTRYSARST